jgi:hypothetical protein
MRSPTAARLSWLMPDGREVHRVYRRPPTCDLETGMAACVRCGGGVTAAGTGARAAVYFAVRDRGTKWKGLEYGAVHRGCIPDRETTARGISPRALSATQVRA